jgi:putative zinc finger/helix-turn-helix YgiT family protein
MTNPPLRKCMVCRERAVAPTTLPSYTSEMEHDGRKYTVTVADFHVLQCQRCGDLILDDAANKRLSDALRAEVGLLAPSEIRKKREALNLTQKQLAQLLRIAESTLSRWETGAQIQQKAMDAFLRVFFQSAEARSILQAPDLTHEVASEPLEIMTS